MMAVSVLRALGTAGSWNAMTPLLTASTPVMAVQPLAKARIKIQRLPAICGSGNSAGGHNRRRVATGRECLEHAVGQHGKQADDEQVGRNHKRNSRLAHAAEVDNREQCQDRQTENQGVGLEPGECRHQGSHTGRDAHGDDQHVVEHERGGGEQAGGRAQVLLGHGVRAAAVGIRRDRLPVGEIDDHQDDDDQRADRPNVPQAGRSQRNEQREGSLRTVGGRAQRVESEHRNAREHPDPLLTLFVSRQRPAEQVIRYGHDQSSVNAFEGPTTIDRYCIDGDPL